MSTLIFILVTIGIIAKVISSNATVQVNRNGQETQGTKQEIKPYPKRDYTVLKQNGKSVNNKNKAPQQMSMNEGECIEEHPDHCAVEHQPDSVYASEISENATVEIDREQLVNGIIMSEILSKPKCFERF